MWGEYSSGCFNTGRLSGRQDAVLHGRRDACRYTVLGKRHRVSLPNHPQGGVNFHWRKTGPGG
jgi:hypothetical protein